MNAQHAKSRIEAGRVIAILRGDYTGYFRPIARAGRGRHHGHGSDDQLAGALDGLHEMCAELGDRFLVGTGTMLNESQVFEALNAGAQFVVAPTPTRAWSRSASSATSA